MSPTQYAARYWDLQVPIVQNDKVSRWQSVQLHQYLLIVKIKPTTWDKSHPGNEKAFDNMLEKLWDHFGKSNEKKATLTVHFKDADGARQHVEFRNWDDLWYHARKAIEGKGSPEEAAITLQLADRFGLLKGGDLQAYSDKYLGLDCNGFVGNYIVHGLRGQDWDAERPLTDYLANKLIDEIVKKYASVDTDTVEDLKVGTMYVFALVGANGKVVPGGGLPAGHIFITIPGSMWQTDYIDDKKKVNKVWTMWASESTSGKGLATAPCQFLGVKNGIFTVKRLSVPATPAYEFRAFWVS